MSDEMYIDCPREYEQAQEEAHYWFALTDVVSHMERIGVERVLIDVATLLQERKEIRKRKELDVDDDF